jgi:hypothetical protein
MPQETPLTPHRALPSQSGLHTRRAKLAATIEWLVGVFATSSPAAHDPVVVIDSTPVECGRSVATTRRSQLAEWRRSGAVCWPARTRVAPQSRFGVSLPTADA